MPESYPEISSVNKNHYKGQSAYLPALREQNNVEDGEINFIFA